MDRETQIELMEAAEQRAVERLRERSRTASYREAIERHDYRARTTAVIRYEEQESVLVSVG